jgi:hypothetical protein
LEPGAPRDPKVAGLSGAEKASMPLPKRRVKLSRIHTPRLINFFDGLTIVPCCPSFFFRCRGTCPAVCGKAWQFRGPGHACNTFASEPGIFAALFPISFCAFVLLPQKATLGLFFYFPYYILSSLRYPFCKSTYGILLDIVRHCLARYFMLYK